MQKQEIIKNGPGQTKWLAKLILIWKRLIICGYGLIKGLLGWIKI